MLDIYDFYPGWFDIYSNFSLYWFTYDYTTEKWYVRSLVASFHSLIPVEDM